MRRINDYSKAPRNFSGSWTIYRRKEDAALWEQFELDCIRHGTSSSEALAALVRAYMASNKH